MTDYFCDPTATYDGDGTSASGAASAGAAGAAKDFFALLSNTHSYVTLVDGDRVFLRSKSGGSNVRVTMTANITMYGGYTNPVQFIVDDGTYWAGDEGYFEVGFGTSSYSLTWGPWISMLGTVHSVDSAYTLRFVKSNTGQNQKFMNTSSALVLDYGVVQLKNVHMYSEVGPLSGRGFYAYFPNIYTGIFEIENVLYDGQLINTSTAYDLIMEYRTSHTRFVLKNWAFENTSAIGLSNDGGFVSHSYMYGASVYIDNVDFTGFPSNRWIVTPNGYSQDVGVLDTIKNSPAGDMDRLVLDWYDASPNSYLGGGSRAQGYISYEGDASNDYRTQILTRSTKAAWDKSKFIPTLLNGAAILPDGVTPWTMVITPIYVSTSYYVSVASPIVGAYVEKEYTGATAQKTLTFEMAWRDTSVATGSGSGVFDTIDNTNLWMEVEYEDASGTLHHEITLRQATVSASTTTWTAESGGQVVWDSQNFNKMKISYQTQYAIKQNSFFKVRLCSTLINKNTTTDAERWLVNPDVIMS